MQKLKVFLVTGTRVQDGSFFMFYQEASSKTALIRWLKQMGFNYTSVIHMENKTLEECCGG